MIFYKLAMNKPLRILTFILLCWLMTGCTASTQPYLHHELSFSKAGSCAQNEGKFSMNSNTNGERYEFQQCLDAGFSKDRLLVSRKGDTVVVAFKDNGQAQALFNLTLDIDTYPRYHFLTIGETTFPIIPANN
jgi:hypothetical protein